MISLFPSSAEDFLMICEAVNKAISFYFNARFVVDIPTYEVYIKFELWTHTYPKPQSGGWPTVFEEQYYFTSTVPKNTSDTFNCTHE